MIAPSKASKQESKPRKRPRLALVAILCGFVVAGAFILVQLATDKSKSAPPLQQVSQNIIPEAPHITANTNTVAKADEKQEKPTSPITNGMSAAWRKYYDGRDTNKWKVVYNPITKKEYISRIVKTGLKNAPPPLYSAHALNLLDAIAFKPIVSPMANVRIDDRFMKSLQNGLIEKITIEPDDPADVVARKQGMIELQQELRTRLKNGEDIKQLIADSLADRNRVANLKQAMRVEKTNMQKNGVPQSEIDEFVSACNRRLSELGASPIVTKAILKERLEQQQQH